MLSINEELESKQDEDESSISRIISVKSSDAGRKELAALTGVHVQTC